MQINAAFRVSFMPVAGMMSCIAPSGRFRAAMPASLILTENSGLKPDFIPAPNRASVEFVLLIPAIELFMLNSRGLLCK